MAKTNGLIDDDKFHFFPQRIGKCTLWYGKKRSFFPFHALMGSDWPCMLITYFLILCPSYYFITGPASEVGIVLVVLTSMSTIFTCCAFSAAACSDPGIIYKHPSGVALNGNEYLHVSQASKSSSNAENTGSINMNTGSSHLNTPYTALSSSRMEEEGRGVSSLLHSSFSEEEGEGKQEENKQEENNKNHLYRQTDEKEEEEEEDMNSFHDEESNFYSISSSRRVSGEEKEDSLRHRRDDRDEEYDEQHHDIESSERSSSNDPILPSSSSNAPSALELYKQKAEEQRKRRTKNRKKTPDRSSLQQKHFSHLESHNKKAFPYTRKGQRIYNEDGSIRTVECSKCDMERPITATHCYECGLCVNDLDHHCPWTGKCIAEKNLRPFYWFLGALAFHLTFLFIAFMYFVISKSRDE